MLAVSRALTELVGARVLDADDAQAAAPDRAAIHGPAPMGPMCKDAGYVIDGILGAGGMGVAFLAHVADDAPPRAGRPAAGTRCVLKVLLPEVVIREAKVAQLSFKKEVVALARLAERRPPSPFVVRWLDAGEMPVTHGESPIRLPWCAVELVDGRPLGTTLEERLASASGPLEPARAAALIEGIVRGVRAVHSVGLIHRDLKPSNVLVCGEPPHEIPKITDFGVARAAGLGDTFDVTVGTTGYCALEQLEGKRAGGKDSVGTWSDVFALGAMIYEILTRVGMYDAPNAMGYVGRVLARNFAPLTTRDDLGDAWSTAEGRALAAAFDAVLSRATSPRSPGGGSIGNDVALPLRHRDVDELLDDLEPLLERMRALGLGVRPASVARVAERLVRRWEWTVSKAAPAKLLAAAVRSDGAVLATTERALCLWDPGASPGGWTELPARPSDRATVGVLHGGAGTFVVARADGEIEVLPGGGGAFSFRLPFAIKSATALAGHPLGTSFLAVWAAHGESVILRLHGRAASPFARLGQTRVRALALGTLGALGEEEVLVAAGSTPDRRGDEAFLGSIDRFGRVAALPPLPGGSADVLAFDADGHLLVAGAEGTATIDARGARTIDERPPARIEALVALPDGQVWGFAPGLAMRRSESGAFQIVHSERALRGSGLLALAASGARVWAVHEDGRVLMGRLSIGSP
ncbi:MAG: serine/threonine protein kinase [Deltaproteobacteria bacterium]|nr:serine/threonine protein kinase [Deltaproteobacteria bacterium]